MSTKYYKKGIDDVWMWLALAQEFDIEFTEAETLLNKIYDQYDFTDITEKELINYAWDNMGALKC